MCSVHLALGKSQHALVNMEVNFVFQETRRTFLSRATTPEGLCYVQLVIYLRLYSKMFYKK